MRVVVGRGTSALVNIATLSDSSGIVCLGGPDPWQSYYPSRAGQWPALFSMPGYSARLDAANEWDFADTADVAAMNLRQAETAGLAGLEDEWVTEVADGESGGFLVRTAAWRAVVAERVDICGGAGPPRRLGSNVRAISGEDFLAMADLPTAARRIGVLGGGPTGAWCVERAVGAGREVTWASRDSFSMAFPPSGRNDHLVRGRSGGSGRMANSARTARSSLPIPRLLSVRTPIWPRSLKTRISIST